MQTLHHALTLTPTLYTKDVCECINIMEEVVVNVKMELEMTVVTKCIGVAFVQTVMNKVHIFASFATHKPHVFVNPVTKQLLTKIFLIPSSCGGEWVCFSRKCGT
jgi:hypothetical protein